MFDAAKLRILFKYTKYYIRKYQINHIFFIFSADF